MILANKKRLSLIIVSLVIILAMTVGIFIGSVKEEITQAAVISNADTISTDLLLPTRVDSNVGGKVFNTLALQELYAKLAGENANFDAVEDNARVKKSRRIQMLQSRQCTAEWIREKYAQPTADGISSLSWTAKNG